MVAILAVADEDSWVAVLGVAGKDIWRLEMCRRRVGCCRVVISGGCEDLGASVRIGG